MQNIILTISLLVSNRIDTIRKCMESIRPILEQLPSELIAIDTVGENTDGSIAVVHEYTDKIYPFTWCNDFSAARNEGLKRAQGEWFMFMDDDEWFEDVTEIIEFFKSGEYKKYKSATYRIHDYTNRQGAYSVGSLNRMIKLEKNTRFVGVIHEYLDPLYLPCKELTSFIHHYGYVFDTQEEHEKHSERNLSLLRPEFEKNPFDLHLRVQMVQECMYLKKLEPEALKLCEESFRMGKEFWAQPAFQWIITAYVRLADRNKEWELVLKRTEDIRDKFPVSGFTQLALSIMSLEACKKLKKYQEAKLHLALLDKSYEFLKNNPEKYIEQNVLDFGVFMESTVLSNAYQNAIKALHELGEKQEAVVWAEKRRKIINKIPLSISLLVSNNKDTVWKCLESLKPLQEQKLAEIIVVDTVGEKNTDGSLQIAREYADKLVHFEWSDDFAAARNAGLDKAQGEWFMFLDDDEWFENVDEIIEFFCTGEYLLYNSGTYKIRNYKNKQGTEYNTVELARMLRLRKDTTFIGTIHETFNELLLPCKKFDSYVHHYGYAYENEAEKMAHLQRNFSLLKKEIEKQPMNLRYRAQMAMELATYDNVAAIEFCEETLRLCAEQKADNNFQWQLNLIFCLYESLGTEAIVAEENYRKWKEKYGFSETAELAICYQMVRIRLLKDTPENAVSYAVKYFELFDYLKQNLELQQLQMTADFYRYQTEEAYLEMLHFGAYSACKAEQYELAWRWYRQMPWEKVGFENEEAIGIVQQLMYISPDVASALDIAKRVMKNTAFLQKGEVYGCVKDIIARIKMYAE